MRRHRHRGFTLLELLIVIGIIAILVSILMPLAGMMRQQIWTVECASKMKAINLALIAYASANDNVLPYPPLIGETYAPPPAAASPLMFYCPTIGIYDYQNGPFWQYLPSSPEARADAFNCPSDVNDYRNVHKGGLSNIPRNFSYSFNVELRSRWLLQAIVNPSHKILVLEENYPNDGCAFLWQGGTGDADDVPAARHSKKCNLGFADGHVDSFAQVDLGYNPLLATNSSASPVIVNAPLCQSYTDLPY